MRFDCGAATDEFQIESSSFQYSDAFRLRTWRRTGPFYADSSAIRHTRLPVIQIPTNRPRFVAPDRSVLAVACRRRAGARPYMWRPVRLGRLGRLAPPGRAVGGLEPGDRGGAVGGLEPIAPVEPWDGSGGAIAPVERASGRAVGGLAERVADRGSCSCGSCSCGSCGRGDVPPPSRDVLRRCTSPNDMKRRAAPRATDRPGVPPVLARQE